MRALSLLPFLRRAAMPLGLALLCTAPLLASDPPEATITSPSGPISTPTNQAVAFTATSTDSFGYDQYTVNSYAWTFGDGGTGAGASTSHAYTAAGTYTVTLTVTYTGKLCTRMDQNGNCTAYSGNPRTATATRTITVLQPPVITSFSSSSSTVEVGKPVTLSWATTNATSWSISGVGAVTGTSVSVSPTVPTTYTLTATGATGSATATVTVSTYTLAVTITPGSASMLLGGSQAFSGSVSPANQGVSWSATGGTMSGSTYTATASGPQTVKVASVEDPTQFASATVNVATVSVATPVPVPAAAQCAVGGTVSFTAQVAGAVDTSVIWSANGGGSITPTGGVFTGSAQGTYMVTATSHADPTKTATATVMVVPLTVTALPASSTVQSGQTETLTALVTGPGSPSQGVTWSVVSSGGGTIVPATGLYTAPATSGDYTVKATSTQDPSCSGTTTIHVPGLTPVWKKDVFYVGTKEVAEVDATGTTWVEFDDHLGSPRFEWDGTAVAGVDNVHLIAQKYGPFGEYLNDPATQAKFEKGFTNHEQTDPSGLIYMQARFYAPMYGRFLSPDPARDQHFEQTQSWNIYSYVQNDPTMRIDPTGEFGLLGDAYDSFLDGAASVMANAGRVPVLGTAFEGGVHLGEAIGGQHVNANGSVTQLSLDQRSTAANQGTLAVAPLVIGGGISSMSPTTSLTGPGGATLSTTGGTLAPAAATLTVQTGNLTGALAAPMAAAMTGGPELPSSTVVKEGGVTVDHKYHSGDHGPAHMHVEGEGQTTRIGPNGKPLKGNPELSTKQNAVVQRNIKAIRKAGKAIGQWLKKNQ